MLVRNYADYRAGQMPLFERVNAVNGEIVEETRKEKPDPAAIGARYLEIESLCRQNEAPLQASLRQQMLVLNDRQRALLRDLADFRRLATLFYYAHGAFLTPPEPPSESRFFDGTPYDSGVQFLILYGNSPDVPSDLTAYLGLTGPQLARIRENMRAYIDFVDARTFRMAEVSKELESEFAAAAPTAIGLGSRYWEIEAQRRQIAERENLLRREMGTLLTPAQNVLIQTLTRLGRSFFLGSEAVRLNLLPPADTGRSASWGGGGMWFAPARTANFSIYRSCKSGPAYSPYGLWDDFFSAPSSSPLRAF